MKKHLLTKSILSLWPSFSLVAVSPAVNPITTRCLQRLCITNKLDQVGRPAINTVFIPASGKDSFNTTIPSQMPALFTNDMKTSLLTLNPNYTTNLLGLTSDQFIGVVSTDVLNAATKGVTSFYNGTQVLTGRTLSDDVIDVELTLVFGGPTGGDNPGLTSDHVNGNDKPFLASFPYEASPW